MFNRSYRLSVGYSITPVKIESTHKIEAKAVVTKRED